MSKIRVLVVDDSTVIRRLLSDALNEHPEIEVVGTAANGKIALSKLPQLAPDLITLDIEMPEMDGLATLDVLRETYPRIPVIMFSTLTLRGADATLTALSKGASDYVTKPANVGSVTAALQNVRDELIPKIRAICWKILAPGGLTQTLRNTNVSVLKSVDRARRIDAVAIGASTGGPSALQTVLTKLPRTFPVPIFVTQHMPPVFTGHFASRLNQMCALDVREGIDGAAVTPGQVWIAPGDKHMTVLRIGTETKIRLTNDPPENSCRPAVDVMMRSVCGVYGGNVAGVILTGMGQDGKRGCQLIRDLGGQVIVQDEATCVVWGMPRAVSEAGLADMQLPLELIADSLNRGTSARSSNRNLTMVGQT